MGRDESELRPRGPSHAGPSTTAAAAATPAPSRPAPPRWRRWRLPLLGLALYATLLLLWLLRPHGWLGQSLDRADAGRAAAGLFSAEADAAFVLQFEDAGLVATRELLQPRPRNVSTDHTAAARPEDPQTLADAEAHAQLVRPLPAADGHKRRLRCLGWRATAACSPDGARRPSQDLPCSKVVPDGAAGYCEVQDKDSGERFRVMRRHCSSMLPDAHFRCSEAWDFANFAENARRAALKALQPGFSLPNMANSASGRAADGIVMVVYPKLLASAYASVRVLRDVLDCSLPVEVWFKPQELSNFPAALDQLKLLATGDGAAISFHEIEDPNASGFNAKVYALYHSQLARVLFLDADNVPTRDPSFLFQTNEFQDTGAVFWPDFWHPNRTIFNIRPQSLLWELVGLPFVNMFEQESGQLLVDRRRHAAPLALVYFYAFHRPNHFERLKLAYGDKDLFRLAWLKLHASFHMVSTPPAIVGKVVNDSFCGLTMAQHDLEGHVLFLHRNSHKLTGLPKRKAVNLKAATLRRIRLKRERMRHRDGVAGNHSDEEEMETLAPTLEPPEPDGYPDAAVWTHLLAFRNSSRHADYVVGTYQAEPEFPSTQHCYGQRYLNDTRRFEVHEVATLSFAGLETHLRRYAAEAAQLHQSQVEAILAERKQHG